MNQKSIIVASMVVAAAQSFAAQNLVVYATVGQVCAGSGASTVASLNSAFCGANGKVGFTGNLNPSDNFVFFDSSIVWKNSSSTFGVLAGAEGTMGVSDSGKFIYSPSVGGNDAVVGNLGSILKKTDPIPDQPTIFSSFNSRPQMSANGTAYWIGGYASTATGATVGRILMKQSPSGTVSSIFKTFDTVLGITLNSIGISFEFGISDNGNNYITVLKDGGAETVNDNLVINQSTAINEAVALGGGELSTTSAGPWRFPSINDSGRWATFSGTNLSSRVIFTDSGIKVRSLQVLDGVTLTNNDRGLDINNAGIVCHLWNAVASSALFIGHIDHLDASRLIAKSGDQIDTDGDFIADSTLNSIEGSSTIGPSITIDGANNVYARVKYQDNVTAVIKESVVRFTTKLGDIDRDGEVGSTDFDSVVAAYGTTPTDAGWVSHADQDFDGEIGASDFDIVVANFGN